MQALIRLVRRHKGVFATAAVGVLAVAILVAVGYSLNLSERRRSERARDQALVAQEQTQQARAEAEAAAAALERASAQAAPEFVAKAARALQARRWEEAREAAEIAVGLDPEFGAAWFEKRRGTTQTGDLATAADCFGKVQADERAGADLRQRAGRLEALSRDYGRQERAGGKLSMPQHTQLGRELQDSGEMALAGEAVALRAGTAVLIPQRVVHMLSEGA